jgi:hypothetical protein
VLSRLPLGVEDGQVVGAGEVLPLGLERGHLAAVPLQDVGQDRDWLTRVRPVRGLALA